MAPAPSPRRKLLQLPFVTSPVYRELVILDIIGAPHRSTGYHTSCRTSGERTSGKIRCSRRSFRLLLGRRITRPLHVSYNVCTIGMSCLFIPSFFSMEVLYNILNWPSRTQPLKANSSDARRPHPCLDFFEGILRFLSLDDLPTLNATLILNLPDSYTSEPTMKTSLPHSFSMFFMNTDAAFNF